MRFFAIIIAVLLVGCGQAGTELVADQRAEPTLAAMNVKEEAPAAAAEHAAPQIAYSYSRRYRTSVDGVAALQARHVALCQQAGKGVCHILS